jgi:hypothetical protein
MKNKESNSHRETAILVRGSRWFSPGRVAGKPYPSRLAWLPQVASAITSLLKEIFDESAYSRFLERNRISPSATAYARFREENDRLKAQRPRCC